MAKIEKLIERFLSRPRDLTWDELLLVLAHFGYEKIKNKKTRGSRRKFKDEKNNVLSLHEPHPLNIVKLYQIDLVLEELIEKGKL